MIMITVRYRFIRDVLINSFKKFQQGNALVRAAALSYYTIFSLPPMLLVILFTTTLFYDPQTVRQTIFGDLADVIGRESAAQLANTVRMAGIFEGKWWTTLLGIGALLFTSTTVFVTIQDALNRLFMVRPRPNAGWLKMLRDRIISFTLLLSIGFILVVSLTINALVAKFSQSLMVVIPSISVLIIEITALVLPFLITALLFMLIFKYLPDVRLPWKSVMTGGIVTAVLFFIGMYFIKLYISNSYAVNLYQAAGSVMVIMVWVYYASVIFLFGAALTFSFNESAGFRMPAEDYAVKTVNLEIETGNPPEHLPDRSKP
ncbi:membrane protein [Nitrosomonas sp. Nm51]|uniref:YihY/virulence factor BrkB family protein n=1 Tax=Nitrosomonas sp. Nm51 TaxID=133720 RepID=UPI0008AB5071|nr:YihY/virulence factor BrkB family protein [Nitrosomonas sp. Nm51]SER26552.1 membrane protein [Nitrosomonas sp. Nm51]